MQLKKFALNLVGTWRKCTENFNYEKIECWMQGVRDYIKYIKRGYTRPTHLASIDLRNQRMSQEEAQAMIRQFEGKRPPSLDLFLEYVGLAEEEFYAIATGHQVSPWQFDSSAIRQGERTPDFNQWLRVMVSTQPLQKTKLVAGLRTVRVAVRQVSAALDESPKCSCD